MARPSKPAAVIEAEGKSHRTKAELEARKQAESAMLTGKRCSPCNRVKADEVAYDEYKRLIRLMQAIEKDDALYASEYNRYCELHSEEEFYKDEIARLKQEVCALAVLSENVTAAAQVLAERLQGSDDDAAEILMSLLMNVLEQNNVLLNQRGRLLKQISDMDLKVKQKREAKFAIEKENCMTVSAALRTIPKDVEKKEDDPLVKLLEGI